MSALGDFKYVVGLAPGKTSLYDPVSKCNLFLTRKVFGFNIEPTTNILTALKHGTLVDIKGNLKGTDTVRLAPDQLAQIQAAVQPPPVQSSGPAADAGYNHVQTSGAAAEARPATEVRPAAGANARPAAEEPKGKSRNKAASQPAGN